MRRSVEKEPTHCSINLVLLERLFVFDEFYEEMTPSEGEAKVTWLLLGVRLYEEDLIPFDGSEKERRSKACKSTDVNFSSWARALEYGTYQNDCLLLTGSNRHAIVVGGEGGRLSI